MNNRSVGVLTFLVLTSCLLITLLTTNKLDFFSISQLSISRPAPRRFLTNENVHLKKIMVNNDGNNNKVIVGNQSKPFIAVLSTVQTQNKHQDKNVNQRSGSMDNSPAVCSTKELSPTSVRLNNYFGMLWKDFLHG